MNESLAIIGTVLLIYIAIRYLGSNSSNIEHIDTRSKEDKVNSLKAEIDALEKRLNNINNHISLEGGSGYLDDETEDLFSKRRTIEGNLLHLKAKLSEITTAK
ncbi:hypothetical protein EJV47_07200 [Hymenobacter gummosus]|uniref:Uncharacterized protein n=1 Tax=Hymenobacter gummosus TaxID=1776032 RepID=A0A3S0H6V1_9BACT|nr:hypothetical protein [Hymenobacter gummosus]RTQ51579.1 hypothetical protein EJV47_07200 [Hymenobacter gummosus]